MAVPDAHTQKLPQASQSPVTAGFQLRITAIAARPISCNAVAGGEAVVHVRSENGDNPRCSAVGNDHAMMLHVWLPLPDLSNVSTRARPRAAQRPLSRRAHLFCALIPRWPSLQMRSWVTAAACPAPNERRQRFRRLPPSPRSADLHAAEKHVTWQVEDEIRVERRQRTDRIQTRKLIIGESQRHRREVAFQLFGLARP